MSFSFSIKQLQGLQIQLELAAQMSELCLGDKWKDLQVSTWQWVECIQEPIQTDRYVTGLFPFKLFENSCRYKCM